MLVSEEFLETLPELEDGQMPSSVLLLVPSMPMECFH